jgi:uncharacterized protein YeaO (DUF488 family)
VTIQLKRAYDQPSKSDGTRILVDRLWPRGVTKAKARIDLWSKEIAPSTELRKWFHREGEGADWKEFRRRYLVEVKIVAMRSNFCAAKYVGARSHWFSPPAAVNKTMPRS